VFATSLGGGGWWTLFPICFTPEEKPCKKNIYELLWERREGSWQPLQIFADQLLPTEISKLKTPKI
jgi:hypothetical protein